MIEARFLVQEVPCFLGMLRGVHGGDKSGTHYRTAIPVSGLHFYWSPLLFSLDILTFFWGRGTPAWPELTYIKRQRRRLNAD